MAAFTWDYNNPLSRQAGERRNAWEAFRDYVRMGPGRSLRKLARGYGGECTREEDPLLYVFFEPYMRQGCGRVAVIPPTNALRTLEHWSAAYAWQARLDRHFAILGAARAARLREQRVELERVDYEGGELLRERTRAMLAEMADFLQVDEDVQETVDGEGHKTITRTITLRMRWSVTQAATALKTASDLQRLAVGLPTSNQRLVDERGDDVMPAMIGIEIVNRGAQPAGSGPSGGAPTD